MIKLKKYVFDVRLNFLPKFTLLQPDYKWDGEEWHAERFFFLDCWPRPLWRWMAHRVAWFIVILKVGKNLPRLRHLEIKEDYE